jgi:dTDP-4-amino-4,6-dideoxy-D-galactose acyltransferase
MKDILEILLYDKKEELLIYSPYNFIRNIDKIKLVEDTLIKPLLINIQNNKNQIQIINIENQQHFFITKLLDWDTNYFGFPVYKIELIIYNHQIKSILNKAIKSYIKHYVERNSYHFINIPCEDIMLTQALCNTGFQLVETRLNYFLSNLQNYKINHYPIRRAGHRDIKLLSQIAIKMRNNFDRVHADPAFSKEIADVYLGTFISECIKGFSDIVLVPDIPGIKPFGFLAGNKPDDIIGIKVSKLVLAAVDNTVQKGWLFKLLSQMISILKEANADWLTTITQASNRPAINVWEKAGFKLGFTTHIFSIKKYD